MTAPAPNVFAFTDYREYLARFYAYRKSVNPRFSHRKISEWVESGSSGWFSDVVKGRINISGTYLTRLIEHLGFRSSEADFFETLVRYAQAGSMEEKNRYWEKILSFKAVKADLVGKDKFEYYARWYYAAIRELFFIYDFRGDFQALARKMRPRLKAAEARKAVELLERLELVRKDEQGRYRPTAGILRKDTSDTTLHLANFLKSNIGLGIKALETLPKEERDFSALTLVLSAEELAAAKSEIKSMRGKLLALSEKNKAKGKVFQCNFQIFPVSE